MIELTDRQREILNFIIDFKTDKEYSPTLREIANGTGNKSVKSAVDHCIVLEKKGYIFKEPGISRGIKIIKEV